MGRSKKQQTTNKEQKEEIIPSPLGAKAPDISERIINQAEVVDEMPEPSPELQRVTKAVMGVPGLSAKKKFQIIKVVESNLGLSKQELLKKVAALSGMDTAKGRAVETILKREIK
jgi:hypothetical protein